MRLFFNQNLISMKILYFLLVDYYFNEDNNLTNLLYFAFLACDISYDVKKYLQCV